MERSTVYKHQKEEILHYSFHHDRPREGIVLVGHDFGRWTVKRQKIMAETTEKLLKMMGCFALLKLALKKIYANRKSVQHCCPECFMERFNSIMALLPWNSVVYRSAIALGALTATRLCVDELCSPDSAERDSNPVKVTPGVILGSFTGLSKSARFESNRIWMHCSEQASYINYCFCIS